MNKTKEILIEEIKTALHQGVLQPSDLRAFVPDVSSTNSIEKNVSHAQHKPPIGNVFYNIAGILLFAVLLSVVFQTSGDEFYFLHIILTTITGIFLWAIAATLQRRATSEDDTLNGLKDALLLTGLLSVLAGVFIMTAHEMVNANDDGNFFIILAAFLALAVVLHAAADVIIKSYLLLCAAILFSVVTLGLVAAQLLSEANATSDAWAVTIIIVSGWLALQTRLLSKRVYHSRLQPTVFDGLALWTALLAAYFANFGDFGVLWLIALALSVFGIFYMSVVQQKRYFLGTGAFFLVLTLVTISFKYFSDFGVTVSLFFSLIAVLGSAYLTSVLNKKYFK